MVCADLKVVTERVANHQQRISTVEQPIKMAPRRMDHKELYVSRWKVKLIGIPESTEENSCLEASKFCQSYVCGEKRIIRLMVVRDFVCKALLICPTWMFYLQFREDFSRGDRETRQKLWPDTEQV